ncbi:MAG: hypothetical protein QXS38_01450 [Candidatus Pacearchaeota archaeon]
MKKAKKPSKDKEGILTKEEIKAEEEEEREDIKLRKEESKIVK